MANALLLATPFFFTTALDVTPLDFTPLGYKLTPLDYKHLYRSSGFADHTESDDTDSKLTHIPAASRCWEKVRPVYFQMSGAGVGKIKAFDRVLKDGKMRLGCFKDSMLLAEKHASIVRYNDHVAKEDREPMTPDVCFNFCRTIPDMSFFGILNGYDCYCEPYYKTMASDSSQCDSTCEGDDSQMCGGTSKSHIWEMHYCNDGAFQLAAAAMTAFAVQAHMDELIPKAKDAANGKNKVASELQKTFSEHGDPVASRMMQEAKVTAGDLLQAVKDAEKERDALRSKILSSEPLTGVDPAHIDFSNLKDSSGDLLSICKQLVPGDKAAQFVNFEVSKKGDELAQGLSELTTAANKTTTDLQKLFLLSEPMVGGSFNVVFGSCVVDDNGCVRNRLNADGKYVDHDACMVELIRKDVPIKVVSFDTEKGYDWLTINGISFTGDLTDSDIAKQTKATGAIYWGSDYSVGQAGWKICELPSKGDERGIQYYPAMYFVDKKYKDIPMTCDGDLVEKPIYYKNYHGCASACDARPKTCKGFAYFPTGKFKPNLCFLFSRFTTGQYYTGCSEKKDFLQIADRTKKVEQPLEEEPTYPVCMAKLSKYVGLSLEPDPSGKCDHCFKEITKANRCWK